MGGFVQAPNLTAAQQAAQAAKNAATINGGYSSGYTSAGVPIVGGNPWGNTNPVATPAQLAAGPGGPAGTPYTGPATPIVPTPNYAGPAIPAPVSNGVATSQIATAVGLTGVSVPINVAPAGVTPAPVQAHHAAAAVPSWAYGGGGGVSSPSGAYAGGSMPANVPAAVAPTSNEGAIGAVVGWVKRVIGTSRATTIGTNTGS